MAWNHIGTHKFPSTYVARFLNRFLNPAIQLKESTIERYVRDIVIQRKIELQRPVKKSLLDKIVDFLKQFQ